jgi:hypothetical protein
MTTNVTVKTHDWPVLIHTTDRNQETDELYAEFDTTVPPNSVMTVYLTQTRELTFKELPKPDNQETATS